MNVFIKDRLLKLDPNKNKMIGKGGEADVFDIGNGMVLKLFKRPDHPDFDGEPDQQAGARQRIATHQTKLLHIPDNLPARLVRPVDIAYDNKGGAIVGYTMPFLSGTTLLRRYAERKFRDAGVPQSVVLGLYRDLHPTVVATHKVGVTIGDFNDLNELVDADGHVHLIDVDSMQWTKNGHTFLCRAFTTRFVDPTKCDPSAKSPTLVQPYDAGSDWYSFAVMLFQSFCLVDPYGGVYVPADAKKRIPHDMRPLRRITVFNSEVRYPKPAIPFGRLPDDLLQQFHLIFEKDERGEFPINLLETMRWTTCSNCQTEHARGVCPECATAAPAAIKQTVVTRGTVTANRIFRTHGTIVFATVDGGKVKWLYNENSVFRREDGNAVLSGDLDPHMRYRIHGDSTLLGKKGLLVTLAPLANPKQQVVDTYLGEASTFDANTSAVYWSEQGRLMRSGQYGSEFMGNVFEGQTLIWVGEKFGFGFYQAGGLQQPFLFDAKNSGINDSLKLPRITGQLLDATAVFGADHCWFFVSYESGGRTLNRCTLIRGNGTIEASLEVASAENSWLGSGIRGMAAAGNFLLVATDDGIVRVEAEKGVFGVTKSFPDTEPFVEAGVRLLVGSDGLYVVSRHEVTKLTIK